MGACSSRCVSTATGAEGTSTSVPKSEYHSERCEAMKRSRGQFSDDVEMEIEFSKPHWSEVSRAEVAPQSAADRALNRENRKVLRELATKYPGFFRFDLDAFRLGRKIAEGGQAEIYEVAGWPGLVMKVFARGTPLRGLMQSCPLAVVKEEVRQCIISAGMLEDGRFAFSMSKCWGDLRKWIDLAMRKKNVGGVQCPPFPFNAGEEGDNACVLFRPLDFMLAVARHMLKLQEWGISHRDLKASNVLCAHLKHSCFSLDNSVMVADFECSIGVVGTGYWRAPEVLKALALRQQETITNEQWMQADVYSYGMTCFEIMTGRIPFDAELENTIADRQLVIEGRRPQLPSDLDDALKDLITKCWAHDPSLRPTFSEIVDVLETSLAGDHQFRLFDIGDELPPEYHLATIEEVDECRIAASKAMSVWEIANLENGSISGCFFGMETRLEKRSDVGQKLARLHH